MVCASVLDKQKWKVEGTEHLTGTMFVPLSAPMILIDTLRSRVEQECSAITLGQFRWRAGCRKKLKLQHFAGSRVEGVWPRGIYLI